MSQLLITGKNKISGTHVVPGNKNAALPMLTACLLTKETVVLENLPIIADVLTTIDMLKRLGVDVAVNESAHTVSLTAANVMSTVLDERLCAKARGSILFAGPMLARCGEVTLAQPGGDAIGRRRIDTHVLGLTALGAEWVGDGGQSFRAPSGGLVGARMILDECSVTATENIVMAACLAKGRTTIYNAACEPHVQDLCGLLNAMGAEISGAGTNLITVNGVDELHGARRRIGPDYIDAGSYMTAALVTRGELTLKGVRAEDFEILAPSFRKFGVEWKIDGDALHLPGDQVLASKYDLGEAIPKIENGPWPSFPADLMSILIVLATQTRGTTLFFDKMFESRMFFVDHLINMGARIVICDPHRVVVTGPTNLHGAHVTSPDIRAGIALIIAALAAEGKSEVQNAESIDRGYEDIEARIAELGGVISRTDPDRH